MTDPTLSNWIQIFSAFLTPVIALAVGTIAFLQWWTNHNKLKLDLFERRLAVFTAIEDALLAIIRKAIADESVLQKLSNSVVPSRFLFDRDLENYVRAIYRDAVELSFLAGEYNRVPIGEKESGQIKRRTELMKSFMTKFEARLEKFEPFLAIKQSVWQEPQSPSVLLKKAASIIKRQRTAGLGRSPNGK